MVFPEDDPGHRYFHEIIEGECGMVQDDEFFTIEKIRNADHLFTPLACQEELLDLISNWVTEQP
jgi:hypothetical protein